MKRKKTFKKLLIFMFVATIIMGQRMSVQAAKTGSASVTLNKSVYT